MKGTVPQSKRIPRKLKKEIVSTFGRETYARILNSQLHIRAKIIGYPDEKGWNYKFHGYSLFFKIMD